MPNYSNPSDPTVCLVTGSRPYIKGQLINTDGRMWSPNKDPTLRHKECRGTLLWPQRFPHRDQHLGCEEQLQREMYIGL